MSASNRGVLGCGVVAAILGLVFISLLMSGATVQAGHVGVLLTWGRVEPMELQPGFHFIVPIAQRIVQVETRVRPHNFKEIDAASSEYQTVKMTGTMNYHLQAERASELYQTVGLDFDDRVIDPAFNDFIKEVVPHYSVTEILLRRDDIRTRAKEMLGANLARYGIVVDDIYISNMAFSREYQEAIERKQTAQQNVEAERQILAQKEIQAQQAFVEARGRADGRVATAEGDAKANELLTASLSPQLIEYTRWIKWDGRLPMVSGDRSTLLTLPIDGLQSATSQPNQPNQPSPPSQR